MWQAFNKLYAYCKSLYEIIDIYNIIIAIDQANLVLKNIYKMAKWIWNSNSDF